MHSNKCFPACTDLSNVKVLNELLTKVKKGVIFVLGFLGLYFDGGSLMTCRHFF